MYHDCSLIFRGEGIPNSRYDSIARASFNISDAFTFAPYRGVCELAALRASSDKRTLFPEKRMLRSAGRRKEDSTINQL